MIDLFSSTLSFVSFFISFKSYDDEDSGPDEDDDQDISFTPSRPVGPQFDSLTRNTKAGLVHPINFFKLFFTAELVSNICRFTNDYALGHGHVHEFLSYGDKDGTWSNHVDSQEMYAFIGMLIYMGLHELPNLNCYWSHSWAFYNPVAHQFGTRLRFESILQFLHVVDYTKENRETEGRLTKIKYLLDYIRDRCMTLFQPSEYISIDERMVKSKGRSGMRQYIRDKPIKWGFKLWVLADSIAGYTYNFFVYTGKSTGGTSEHGLGYTVVFDLLRSLLKQGYHVFFDNFYTSVQLLRDLFTNKTYATGTILRTRKNFPQELKVTTHDFQKKSERGDMRWTRLKEILCVQWMDKKLVTLMSTKH